jgi:hypothetical protein
MRLKGSRAGWELFNPPIDVSRPGAPQLILHVTFQELPYRFNKLALSVRSSVQNISLFCRLGYRWQVAKPCVPGTVLPTMEHGVEFDPKFVLG